MEVRSLQDGGKARLMAKPKDKAEFDLHSENGGSITFRCLSLTISSDDDSMTSAEIAFVEEMIRCFNSHSKWTTSGKL